MALQTSVGPICSSIFLSGHSTTVTNGNMYSFLAIAASGDVAVHDGRQQVLGAPILDDARTSRWRRSRRRRPALCRSASMAGGDRGGRAGNGERGQARFGIVRRQGTHARQPLSHRVGISRVAARPDARAVDAPAAAVGEHAVDHHVEVLLPVIHLVVAEQNLGEAGAVRLHARDCRDSDPPSAVPPKIRLRPQPSSTAAPTSPSPG